jgi:hypothetical protein
MHSNRFGTYNVWSTVASAVDIMLIYTNFSLRPIHPEILLNHIYTYNYSKFFSDLILWIHPLNNFIVIQVHVFIILGGGELWVIWFNQWAQYSDRCLTFTLFLTVRIFSKTSFSLQYLSSPFHLLDSFIYFSPLRESLAQILFNMLLFSPYPNFTFQLIWSYFTGEFYFSSKSISYFLLGHMIKELWGTCRSLFHQLLYRSELLSCLLQAV